MRKLLEQFKVEKKVISIHSDPNDTNGCWTGFVVDVDDEHVLIAHISSNGFYGGYVLIQTEDILFVEEGGAYERRMQKLYELRKQSHPEIILDNELELLTGILKFAKEKEKVTSIELVEDDEYAPVGFVHDVTEDYICLNTLTNEGEPDSITYVKVENVHKIFMDTLPEQNIRLLYEALNK